MVEMILMNGKVFVWNPHDWYKLRQEHHLVGSFIGCLSQVPRQNTFGGLPLTLLKEEVTLILEKKIGKLVTLKDPYSEPAEEVKLKFEDYLQNVNAQQIEHYEEERKKQLTSMIDRIVEGKKRKMMGLNTKKKKGIGNEVQQQDEAVLKEIEIDREAILKSELEKAAGPSPGTLLVQTFTGDPWYKDEDFTDAEWNFPITPQESLRYRVFKDLWEKNYYITPGSKFGGDFLVYPGEPVKFHSHFIVLCLAQEAPLQMLDLVAHSRLATSTRKTLVLASIDGNDEVSYQSIQWAEVA